MHENNINSLVDYVQIHAMELTYGQIAKIFIRCGVDGFVEQTQRRAWRGGEIALLRAIAHREN